MAGEPEERQRLLGFPRGPDPYGAGGDESRRIMGMPTDWVGPVDVEWFRTVLHPVRSIRRWRRRRQLGPFLVDEDGDAPGVDHSHDPRA